MRFITLPKQYNWILIVLFFALSILNSWFGLLGILCMGSPLLHALKGNGRLHCTRYCPRGSFLGKFMRKISLGNTLPSFMRTKIFRHALLALMVTMLSLGIYHAWGSWYKVAFTLFRFMGVSFLFGIFMGVFFKGKSWCAVCPMGHAASLITDVRQKIA